LIGLKQFIKKLQYYCQTKLEHSFNLAAFSPIKPEVLTQKISENLGFSMQWNIFISGLYGWLTDFYPQKLKFSMN